MIGRNLADKLRVELVFQLRNNSYVIRSNQDNKLRVRRIVSKSWVEGRLSRIDARFVGNMMLVEQC